MPDLVVTLLNRVVTGLLYESEAFEIGQFLGFSVDGFLPVKLAGQVEGDLPFL